MECEFQRLKHACNEKDVSFHSIAWFTIQLSDARHGIVTKTCPSKNYFYSGISEHGPSLGITVTNLDMDVVLF